MSPVLIAAVTALVAGGPGPGDGRLVAYAPERARSDVDALLLQALPPPPSVVVRTTQRYGEVTIDHAKHLSLRAPCGTCHVSLPIGKITYTPQIAHRTCIGCHKERASGPTQCAGCHVRSLPPPEPVLAEAEAEAETPAAPQAPAVAPRAFVAPSPSGGPLATAAAGPPSRQIVEVGLVAGPGFGPSLRVSSRRERLVTMYSFERIARSGDTRLVGMLGAGLSHRLQDRWEVVAVAMGGFDAIESPAVTILPALGARAGIEWHPRRWRFDTIHVGVAGVVDLARDRAFGEDVGGATFFATIATGLSVRARPLH